MATICVKVPDDICHQGLCLLKTLGATVDDLVAAAFEYLIETGELPVAMPEREGWSMPKGARGLSSRQADELRRSLNATTFPGVELPDAADIKRVLTEGRRRDYETLSESSLF